MYNNSINIGRVPASKLDATYEDQDARYLAAEKWTSRLTPFEAAVSRN